MSGTVPKPGWLPLHTDRGQLWIQASMAVSLEWDETLKMTRMTFGLPQCPEIWVTETPGVIAGGLRSFDPVLALTRHDAISK